MQQEAHQVAPDGFTHHSFPDIQAEKGAGKDYLSEMRINNDHRFNPHNDTAAQSGDRLRMSGKGGPVM